AYLDEEGNPRDVKSEDVNAYLKEITGEDFTAKDFRTWAGTVLAAQALQELARFNSQAQAKRNVLRAVEAVAKRLGNTRAVCRKCYIHPEVVNAFLDGTLAASLSRNAGRELRSNLNNLSREEAAVLALLQRRLHRESRAAAA
ncbi:MAG TPA: hypothetical protein VJR03_13960, partial [Nitrospira sp.]|nr:hypothetical protein [Nitrospira sp.]